MISVIVPVYNAEDYLREAILSVFSQTYKDWELILVDDGSTDSSPQICDSFSSQNNKVRVIHKTNGGLSSARNTGIHSSKGDYIFFLDADDRIPDNALQILHTAILDTKAYIICGRFIKFEKEININIKSQLHIKYKYYTPSEAIKDTLYQHTLDNSAWAKIYAKNIFKDNTFREGTWYEDLDAFYRFYEISNKIVYIDSVIYYYRQHPGSYLHKFNLRRADVLIVTDNLVNYIKNKYPDILPAAKDRQLSANFNILGLISSNGMEKDPEASKIADSCWEKIRELRLESLRNPHVRLKNKIGIMASYLFGRKGVEILSRFVY